MYDPRVVTANGGTASTRPVRTPPIRVYSAGLQLEMAITVTVYFFGPARDWAGVEQAKIELSDIATLEQAQGLLCARFEGIRQQLARCRLAVNQAFATPETRLREGDEVAVIPPVTGGGDSPVVWIDLTQARIDAARLRSFVSGSAACGAVASFDGVVRSDESPDHGRIVRLEYESYREMARRGMHLLAEEAIERYGAVRVAMIHRLGPVPVGETSVSIAVACGHRREAFDACGFLIDKLKQDVPIWKRDVYEDGFVGWAQAQVQSQ